MNNSSNLKRALLIAPRFFGYEQDIAGELTRQGLQVDLLPDRPFDSGFFKAVMRFWPQFGGNQISNRFFVERLGVLNRNDYAIILVIQGEGVTPYTLSMLRVTYPRARMVFYTWDSIVNKPFVRRNLSLYDYCSTFDPMDAELYGLNFRPLFYSPGFERQAEQEFGYDLSFIGTVHSDRYQIVQSLIRQLPANARTFIYLYLQAPWMYDLRIALTKTIEGAKRDEFHYAPLGKGEVLTTFFGSRSVLDIEHPNQRGATMRTFEAIGSQRKIITTNNSLLSYDFYHPQNILILDRHNPKINLEFLSAPYVGISDEVRKKYTLRQWVRDVCLL